jgi:hypothetical protein
MLALIDEIGEEVATLFEDEAADIGQATAGVQQPPTAGDGFRLEQLRTRSPGRLELGMHAARGWSLSSSVVTTLLVTTLHPGLLVVLPITAVLGTVFAIKAVRGVKTARLEAARNEALRSVIGYLNQARVDANRAAVHILRNSRSHIRDYYLDRANELVATAQAERAAALRAADVDAHGARRRVAETATDLARVASLLDAADQAVGVRPGTRTTR